MLLDRKNYFSIERVSCTNKNESFSILYHSIYGFQYQLVHCYSYKYNLVNSNDGLGSEDLLP